MSVECIPLNRLIGLRLHHSGGQNGQYLVPLLVCLSLHLSHHMELIENGARLDKKRNVISLQTIVLWRSCGGPMDGPCFEKYYYCIPDRYNHFRRLEDFRIHSTNQIPQSLFSPDHT